MAKKTGVNGMSFTQACEYLGVSPDQLVMLRNRGLVACLSKESKQVYPRTGLDITQRLLKLGQERSWKYDTLTWYADLVFAAEIGRAILLPINNSGTTTEPQLTSWLEMPYAVTVLDDLAEDEKSADAAIVTPLRSLTALAVGQEQYWPSLDDLRESAIFPIISRFEEAGIPIIGQGTVIARDIGINFVMMMYAYTVIASPISKEFRALVQAAQDKIAATPQINVSLNEQEAIRQQSLIPVDKIYASKATEIHSAPPVEDWNFKLGILRADRRTIALQMKLPLDSDQPLIDNVIDMIRPFLGVFGARVVQLLYEIANDPPYFRHPVISFDTNMMLDRLGLRRDSRGIHRSKNRERLRDALNAAHNLEMVGEYTTWEDGRAVRKQFYRTVLSILGATFDAEETASISTFELRTRGLAKSMQIRLNFYDGIRRPDGKLGNQYVLIPRLVEPDKLPKANYSATHELLRAYLIFRYRQTQMKTRVLQVTRQTVLEKANIRNQNASRATMTLRKALDRLITDGILERYSSTLPTKSQDSFEIVLAEAAVHGLEITT